MEQYKIIIIAVLAAIIIPSCKKSFLDVKSSGLVTKEANVYDLNTTSNYLNGIYINIGQNLFSFGGVTAYPEIIADNIKQATATSTFFATQYSWSQQSNNSTQDPIATTNENKFWLNGYGIIYACNFTIEKADQFRSENAVKADNIKAQALAIRAYINFLLVNTFAQSYNFTTDGSHPGISLVTGSDWAVSFNGRQTVAEIYNAMIADLNAAIPLFQASTATVLYMNRNAAKALLARVYLFKGDFVAAKNTARDVAITVPIMPASATGYPSKLFTNTESEALLQLMPSDNGVSLPSPTGSYAGNYLTGFLGRYFVSPKRFIATSDIATLLTQNVTDLRKVWVTSSAGVWNVTKYPQGVIAGFAAPSASYYQTLLRSSEMYLTAAEAYAKISNEDSARFYLNAIRTRANIPALSNLITGQPLVDSIYLERRRELSFEGLRMFDLLRWKKGVNRTDYWGAAQSLPYPSNKAIAPLPQQDVEAYELTQNLDY